MRRRIVIVSMVIGLALISSILIVNANINTDKNPERATTLSLTAHAPISINGNAGFTNASGVTWGSGTVTDPYIINGWEIIITSGSEFAAIFISNSNAYFQITDCHLVFTGGIAIEFNYVSNGLLMNNNCSDSGSGICIDFSSNIRIENNDCAREVDTGIDLIASDNNAIINNNCSQDSFGINIDTCQGNIVVNNTCSMGSSGWNLQSGISLLNSIGNSLINNTCQGFSWYGIYLSGSDGNTIANNTCTDNFIDNIHSDSSSHNVFRRNSCYSVLLFTNSSNNGGSGGVVINFGSNNILSDNICSGPGYGIEIRNSGSNNVSDNICTNNTYAGIYIDSTSDSSKFNNLIGNICSRNQYGIRLWQYSSNNTLINNTCSRNSLYGIYLAYASNNSLVNNNISENIGYGIYIIDGDSYIWNPISKNNTIWNNTFIGNKGAGSVYNMSRIQAYDNGTDNHWNSSGYGNYWSDWTTPDNVAPFWIVDIPYIISGSAGSRDYYPLTVPPNIISPKTVPSLSGTLGMNNWYKSSVTVFLNATDSHNEVNAIFYRIGTSGSWLNYSSALVFSSDGNYTVQFYSRDNSGINGPVKTINVMIDRTAPTLTINQTAGFEVTVNHVLISWNSSDATIGIDQFEVSIDGGAFVSVGTNMSHNFSGLADGKHNITVRAIDVAGNEIDRTIQVTVQTIASGAVTSGDLMLYGAIVTMTVIILATIFIMMRKKKAPPMKLDEMKAEPPAIP